MNGTANNNKLFYKNYFQQTNGTTNSMLKTFNLTKDTDKTQQDPSILNKLRGGSKKRGSILNFDNTKNSMEKTGNVKIPSKNS